MGQIISYKDLRMWQRSKDFAVTVYRFTRSWPKEETYGLTSQLRRAAVSIPSNIAEGFHRRSHKEKLQFLRIAYGSGAEIETQLLIASELGYVNAEEEKTLESGLSEVMRMLNVVINNVYLKKWHR